jgi:hypothetical protein
VRNSSTPTQRKQACLKTRQVSSPIANVNPPATAIMDDESLGNQFWDEWEAEARRKTQTQEGWNSFMAEKALEIMQKIDPGIIHAKYGGKPYPLNAESLKKLLEATDHLRPRKRQN